MADGKLGPNNQGKRLDSQPDLFEQHFSKFMEAIANKAITPKIKRNLQKAKETNDALEKAAKTAKKKKPTEQ